LKTGCAGALDGAQHDRLEGHPRDGEAAGRANPLSGGRLGCDEQIAIVEPDQGRSRTMSQRRQALLLFGLSLAVAMVLIGQSLIVQVDFEACFGNYAASINGERPFRRVSEMSPGELASGASRSASVDQLIIGVLGLLPLAPFLAGWTTSKRPQARRFWIVCALVATIAIIAWTATRSPTDFYDCELNGVSLGLAIAPIFYAAVNAIAALVLAAFRSTILDLIGRGEDCGGGDPDEPATRL
jgi:hypothetical protein